MVFSDTKWAAFAAADPVFAHLPPCELHKERLGMQRLVADRQANRVAVASHRSKQTEEKKEEERLSNAAQHRAAYASNILKQREYRRIQKAKSRAWQTPDQKAAVQAKAEARKAELTADQRQQQKRAQSIRSAKRRIFESHHGRLNAGEVNQQRIQRQRDLIPEGWDDLDNHVTTDGVLLPYYEVWYNCVRKHGQRPAYFLG